MKPILFNTEMVAAILDGRKTVTRRMVKYHDRTPLSTCRQKLYKMVEELNGKPFFGAGFYRDADVYTVDGEQHIDAQYFRASYRPGDTLYVRETWQEKRGGGYLYKADAIDSFDLFTTPEGRVVSEIPWRPSIHMPKKAARIFLRVTCVRAERLRDIPCWELLKEGIDTPNNCYFGVAVDRFARLWNSTIKKTDMHQYGWDANPWVWVIEFERIRKAARGNEDTKKQRG